MKARVVGHEVEEVSPDTHVFVGTYRPPMAELYAVSCYLACSCGQILQTKGELPLHWNAGHFDFPIYRRIEDVPGESSGEGSSDG